MALGSSGLVVLWAGRRKNQLLWEVLSVASVDPGRKGRTERGPSSPTPSTLEREVCNPLRSPPTRRSQNIHNLYYG